jgi:hypothetical protein
VHEPDGFVVYRFVSHELVEELGEQVAVTVMPGGNVAALVYVVDSFDGDVTVTDSKHPLVTDVVHQLHPPGDGVAEPAPTASPERAGTRAELTSAKVTRHRVNGFTEVEGNTGSFEG